MSSTEDSNVENDVKDIFDMWKSICSKRAGIENKVFSGS